MQHSTTSWLHSFKHPTSGVGVAGVLQHPDSRVVLGNGLAFGFLGSEPERVESVGPDLALSSDLLEASGLLRLLVHPGRCRLRAAPLRRSAERSQRATADRLPW